MYIPFRPTPKGDTLCCHLCTVGNSQRLADQITWYVVVCVQWAAPRDWQTKLLDMLSFVYSGQLPETVRPNYLICCRLCTVGSSQRLADQTTWYVVVCVQWATPRNWQTKLLDTRKVTQLNWLRQEGLNPLHKVQKALLHMTGFFFFTRKWPGSLFFFYYYSISNQVSFFPQISKPQNHHLVGEKLQHLRHT